MTSLANEASAWLRANWRPHEYDAARDRVEWLKKVHAAQWLAPTWPEELGGQACSQEDAREIEAAFKAAGAPGGNADRINIPANVIRKFGTGPVRDMIVGFLTEEIRYCLLYSEPGAGSDLASIRTRADLIDNHYVVSGQKVWTSGGKEADFGLLLARTDWDKPKHKGISFLLCPMRQPGVEVRPIHQITGARHFNEVFLDGATVPAEYLLGTLDGGWGVLMEALYYERIWMGEGGAERKAGTTTSNIPDLIGLARSRGKLDDPVLRQNLARTLAWRKLSDLNMARAKFSTDPAEAERLMSLGKLVASRYLHADASVMAEILGAEAMLDGDSHPDAADANFRGLHAYQNSIGGGTDQIQRNIIAERILGLPREIELDRNIPFRESRALSS